MEDLLDTISKIEGKHMFDLYAYVKHIFHGKHLPSHDENHHLRVWLYCRGLFIELTRIGFIIPDELIENALIACFFHDTGLVDEIGENHGKHGATLCEAYLEHTNFPRNINFSDILEAITMHDDKSLKLGGISSTSQMLSLNRLVSTADDLDSVGYIGIFRYIEIYLKRSIKYNDLPLKVVKNLNARRSNFVANYSSLYQYCGKQKQRFGQTINYFIELDAQIARNNNATGTELEVFNIISKMLVEEGQPLDFIIQYVLNNYTSGYTLQFFSNLRRELDVVSVIIPYATV